MCYWICFCARPPVVLGPSSLPPSLAAGASLQLSPIWIFAILFISSLLVVDLIWSDLNLCNIFFSIVTSVHKLRV